MTDLRVVLAMPTHCHEEVSRGGWVRPCEKPAVAARVDPEEGHGYPVCAYHARGRMVPLAEVISAARAAEAHDRMLATNKAAYEDECAAPPITKRPRS